MRRNNSTFLFIITLFISVILNSCDTTDPPSNKKITLEFEDASCTEAWLNLKTENISLPTEIEIQCFDKLSNHDSTFLSASINTNDTILFIENLQPSSDYNFTAKTNGIHSSISTLRTMDTTSHNFTWETFEIGDRGMLRDVAIINENNIWAVGEIYVNDSTGNSELHNAAHWDGSEWEILKIEYIYNEHGYMAPLYSIFSNDSNSIWVGSNQPMHWNGNIWEQFDLPASIFNGWINKIWVSSNNHVYLVGNDGNIASYDGTTWQKIASNTEVDLLDVWGTEDGSVVWACGYDLNHTAMILKIENGICQITYESTENFGYPVTNKISGRTKSVWGIREDGFNFLTTYGVYQFNSKENGTAYLQYDLGIENWGGATKMRGSAFNDIYIGGTMGRVWHYNGTNWKLLTLQQSSSNEFFNIATQNGLSVFVGEIYNSVLDYRGLIVTAKNK